MIRTNPMQPMRALAVGVSLALAVPCVALAQQSMEQDRADARHASQQHAHDRGAADRSATQRYDVTRERPNQSGSDARREAAIATTFMTNPNLRASDIDVEVNRGTAVLQGTVESDVEKELAERIASNVSGIDRVDNRLRIDPQYRPTARADGDRDFGTAVADATITAQVKSKLLWNDTTDGLDIDVDTRRGRVTLSGTADDAQARQAAERLARNTDGVVAVDNRLTLERDADRRMATGDERRDAERMDDREAGDRVARRDTDLDDRADLEPELSDGWISTKVKSTLLFSRSVSGTAIDVDTDNGVVSLRGTVDSTAEKQLAVQLARDIRGVRQVEASGLTVSNLDRSVAAGDDDR